MSYPDMKLDRSFYQSGLKNNPTLKTETFHGLLIWTVTEPKLELAIWKGKQSKPFHHYLYRTQESMEAAIKKAKESELAHIAFKERMKAENKGKKSEHAHVASLIRAELKKAFPGVKFQVISKSFSGGDSVDINWTNGVTVDQVEAIANKYQAGHFDGMDDIYRYTASETMITEDGKLEKLPTTKYVSTSRHITNDIRLGIARKICEEYGLEYEGDHDIDMVLWRKFQGQNPIYRVYSKVDFSIISLDDLLKQSIVDLI
ncbi:MAG TPA: LPD29 domain-containing protein [Ignavibacteriales bacterium]|nr:LPD29 domain-containing protein [Ignavibacteriales bacterium]